MKQLLLAVLIMALSGVAIVQALAESGGDSSRSSSTSSNTPKEITPLAKASIDSAINWLLKAQNPDGGFGMDINQQSDIACTAIAGLSLMANGSTPVQGPYATQVRKALEYILRQCARMPSNDITSDENTLVQRKIGRYAHTFFATVFLAQALGNVKDPEPVKRALQKLVVAICSAQREDGSFGTDQSWAPILGTVMGWVSLHAAQYSGFKITAKIEATEKQIISQMSGSEQHWMFDLYKQGSGLRVLFGQQKYDDPVAQKAYKRVLEMINRDDTPFTQAGGEEYLAFMLVTHVVHQKQGKEWDTWFPVLRDKIIKVQNKDGSWTGHHCITARTFCTAACLIILQTPNHYVPIFEL